jgi:hypothetical protein
VPTRTPQNYPTPGLATAAKKNKNLQKKIGALAYLAGQSCMTEHQPSNRTSTALVPVQKHQISAAKIKKRAPEPPFTG